MVEHTRQGVVDVISIQGPLNQENIDELDEMLGHLLCVGQPKIALDLKETLLIDSAGLEWLLDARDTCRRRGGILTLAAPNALCRDILKATRLDSEFGVFEDTLTAVGSFAL